jgi:hypothetical protein
MRLWSIHPGLLDTKGLVACWREGLLAQAVLAGKTKGYKNHSQLLRFKQTCEPILYIGSYLRTIYGEAVARGYSFDKEKIIFIRSFLSLPVTNKQLEFEFNHLQKKLMLRDEKKFRENIIIGCKENSFFKVKEGEVELWEVL